jgi:hypothetical protein
MAAGPTKEAAAHMHEERHSIEAFYGRAAVERHIANLLAKTTIACLHCGAVRDVFAEPRVMAGECPRCTYVGWARVIDLVRSDPNYLKEHVHAQAS